MKIFISGGSKNGKSFYAQCLAKAQSGEGPLYYIATMRPSDREDDERIKRHRAERDGWGFITIEQVTDIEQLIYKCESNGSILLDSVTALLANEMFSPDGSINNGAGIKIIDGLLRVVDAMQNIVVVSDYIYSDAFLYDPLTESYRKSLSEIDRAVAKRCDGVLEAVFTNITIHKWIGTDKSLLDTLV